jgi:hypothetical protein
MPGMPTPLTLLRLGEDDLAANRAGRLSADQRRRLRSRTRASALGFGALGLLLIAGGIYSNASGGQWFVPVLLGVLAIAAGLLVARSERVRPNVAVRRITGRVDTLVVRVGRGGTALRLTVDGENCDLPRRRGAGLREWQAVLTDQPYHVYVIGAYPAVVAIEPAN